MENIQDNLSKANVVIMSNRFNEDLWTQVKRFLEIELEKLDGNQSRLADRLGVSGASVNMWMRDTRPSLKQIEMICSIFKLKVLVVRKR